MVIPHWCICNNSVFTALADQMSVLGAQCALTATLTMSHSVYSDSVSVLPPGDRWQGFCWTDGL